LTIKKKIKWTKKLSIEDQKEIKRLKNDGHQFIDNDKFLIAEYDFDNVRNTQLYRTLLHEFGHYVHYLSVVDRLGKKGETYDEWEIRDNYYMNIPKTEKEKFAHNYADKLREELIKNKIIPFQRIED
jgi:hypothetical protein